MEQSEQQGHEEQPVLSAGSVQSAQSGKSAQSAQSVQSEQDEQDLEVRPFASCKMRIIEPTMHPCVVRTDATMAAMFLGAYSRAEAWLFDLGARQSRSTGLLWLLWFLGVSIGLLVLADVLPAVCVGGCSLALPLPAVAFALLSRDLVSKVVLEVEFYIINVLQAVLVTHALMRLTLLVEQGHWDSKCIAIVCHIPSMLVSGLMDAYPAKYRAVFEILFFTGSIYVLLAWNALIIFKHSSLGPVTSQIGDNLTLLLFYLRHIWIAVKSPNALVVVHSSVSTRHEVLNMPEIGQGGGVTFSRKKIGGRKRVLSSYSNLAAVGESMTSPRTASFGGTLV
mmetsp:Transcript_79108/g.219838  ORF Transcript_79108/g.219838 Transcript_79108/m.219838 type:complete len:337 (+) Transcript_79108:102-1112(+)